MTRWDDTLCHGFHAIMSVCNAQGSGLATTGTRFSWIVTDGYQFTGNRRDFVFSGQICEGGSLRVPLTIVPGAISA
jgi:hypothetical protein